MRCKIFIFRHAQSTDNKRMIFSGWRDPALTAQGKSQAHKIAKMLARERIDVAFTSSRKRARDTLKIVLGKRKNVPTIIDDRLIERSYGHLQGKSKVSAAKMYGEKRWQRIHRGYATTIPGGENIKLVEKRVYSFIRELEIFLKVHPCNVAISCHGNSMRPLRKWYQKLTNKQMMALENPQDKDVEVDLDFLPEKGEKHSCIAFNHKHIHGGKVCCEQEVLTAFFQGKRIVKELLPGQMKKKF
jgi:2,3-bisphosphoglycerate-dependent phosphoglycerate mutase